MSIGRPIKGVNSLTCAFLCLLLAWLASADIPQSMSFQAAIRNSDGTPVPDGDYQVLFCLYTSAVGGDPVWTEEQAVEVVNGLTSTVLGRLVPLDLPFDVPYWLGLTIVGQQEFAPRIPLSVSPYALRARIAEGLSGGVPSDDDWVVDGGVLYPASAHAVGIGTAVPHPSALLELSSTERGLLLPSMTTAQRNAISDPADGLLIFNTITSCLNYYANGNWQEVRGTPPCLPDCSGKECGDDGCGGSCGGCPPGEICVGGICQPLRSDGRGELDLGTFLGTVCGDRLRRLCRRVLCS